MSFRDSSLPSVFSLRNDEITLALARSAQNRAAHSADASLAIVTNAANRVTDDVLLRCNGGHVCSRICTTRYLSKLARAAPRCRVRSRSLLVYFAEKSRRGDLERQWSHGFPNLPKQNRARISRRLFGLRVIKTNAHDAQDRCIECSDYGSHTSF